MWIPPSCQRPYGAVSAVTSSSCVLYSGMVRVCTHLLASSEWTTCCYGFANVKANDESCAVFMLGSVHLNRLELKENAFVSWVWFPPLTHGDWYRVNVTVTCCLNWLLMNGGAGVYSSTLCPTWERMWCAITSWLNLWAWLIDVMTAFSCHLQAFVGEVQTQTANIWKCHHTIMAPLASGGYARRLVHAWGLRGNAYPILRDTAMVTPEFWPLFPSSPPVAIEEKERYRDLALLPFLHLFRLHLLCNSVHLHVSVFCVYVCVWCVSASFEWFTSMFRSHSYEAMECCVCVWSERDWMPSIECLYATKALLGNRRSK